ncbi:MAG: tetratricopeptide repeat protein [Planctomycetes bacterium]|nr:tetratricopeptide repeat protein [Planctomycetota bacterium]
MATARQAPMEKARALLAAGRYQEARLAYQLVHEGKTAADARALQADALAGEGLCLYYLGRYGDAVKAFRAALKVRPDFAAGCRGIAWCEYAEKDYREALTALELSFKTEPNDHLARVTAGWCHYYRGDFHKGLEEFQKAQAILPADYGGKLGEGWCLYRLERQDEAFGAFVQAVRLSPYALNAELRALVETRPEWRQLFKHAGWSALRAHLDSWAEREFQTAAALDPADADAVRGLAYAYFRMEQYEKAEEKAELASPAEQSLPGVSFPVALADGSCAEIAMNLESLQAWMDLRQGLYERALSRFRAVREKHPGWVDAACGEGWALYSQGNVSAAERVFTEAERILPGYPDAAAGTAAASAWRLADYNAAWEQMTAGDAQGARAAFERLKAGPDARFPAERADLLDASIGWARYFAGEHDEAAAAFRAALQRSPGLGLAHKGLGYVLMANKEWGLAAGRLKEALEDPAFARDADVAAALGLCLLEAGDAEEAERTLDLAVELNPASANALAARGAFFLRAGKPVDARVEYERAVYIDPAVGDRPDLRERMKTEAELWKLHSALGWSWFQRGDYARAEKEFQEALGKDPLEKSVPRGLGLAFLRSGRVDDAVVQLDRFLAAAPRSELDWGVFSETLSEYGWALFAAGRQREALGVFRRLEELHAGQKLRYADPFDGQGWCYLKLGKKLEAKKAFLSAIEIAPRHENSLKGLETLADME